MKQTEMLDTAINSDRSSGRMKPFDTNGNFRPGGDNDGLARRAVRGAGVAVFSGGLGLAIQMIATVALVRLLSPADFGLMAMATTFSMLLLNFGLNGFTEATIQSEEMDHALATNLFWMNVSTGFLLTIGFAAFGPLLARFYGDPRAAHVAAGLSVTIFFTSISVQHLALLKRAMRFYAVSANELVARFVSVAVSILLGWQGWGYWALVAGAIAAPLSTSIGAWYLCHWTPGLPGPAKGTKSRVWFAANTYGRFTLNYFARNVDNLLVGWRFGAPSLGFYKKAYDLFALPAGQVVMPLNEVALSTLSRLNPRSTQYREYFLAAVSMLAFVGMALAADLTLVGKDLIRLLLGVKWEPAGRIFTLFGPGIGAMIIYQTHGWIHLSIGKAHRWFRWVIVEATVTALLFLLALPWGPGGIAVAWAASFWILLIPSFWYAGKPIDFAVTPILGAIWKYILAALVAGWATAETVRLIRPLTAMPGAGPAALRIFVTSLLLTATYLGAVILFHRGCVPLYQFARIAKEMFPWIRLSTPSPVGAASDSNPSQARGRKFTTEGVGAVMQANQGAGAASTKASL